ncbi:hypothetical protein BGZ73_006369 [Actinomortierella ambigua]|nr:hypothetical protein BGZ73_006369 [Actinomortierella ambigua]
MSSLQPLVFLCIVLIYLFFGEDAQRREYLLNTRDHLRLEALDLPNKTYRANDTYVLPRAIATSVTQLFGQADKDPKSHYYHNITGSFRGRWSIDLETAGLVDKEQPLPEAPEDDDKEKNGSSDSKAPTEPASGGNNTSNTEGPSSSNSTLLADEPGADDGENMEHGMVDAILNTKPKHQGDVATFRGTSFNYTNPGYLQINLKEQKASESINWIEGLWQLKHDDEEDYGLSLAVMGVHFIHNGSIYMWGIPQDAHMPLSHILELMPDEVSFAMAKEAIKDHYDTKIQHVEDILYGVEEYERYEPIASEEASCNYQIFMQLGAVGPEVKPVHLKELEKEWATPQGISTIKAPLLNATMVMYSPNCRLVMQSKHMPGMKIETFYKKCLRLAVVAGVITFIQVFLLAKQLQFTQTPSSVSKVSYWTITIQMIMDAYLFVIYYAAGAILVAIFGMRYMHVIWRIQRPERRGRRAAAAAASAPAGGTNPDGLPLPATARRPSPPSEREQSHLDIQTLARRFYWAFVVAIFIMFEMVWSSRLVKNILWTVIASVMFSFWVPQIIRNALRGSSKALNLWYILGMSVTRLLFPLYLHACPENVFNNEPTPWIWLLVGWVFLQVVVLLLQDWLGPRFFVPVRAAKALAAELPRPRKTVRFVCCRSTRLRRTPAATA